MKKNLTNTAEIRHFLIPDSPKPAEIRQKSAMSESESRFMYINRDSLSLIADFCRISAGFGLSGIKKCRISAVFVRFFFMPNPNYT